MLSALIKATTPGGGTTILETKPDVNWYSDVIYEVDRFALFDQCKRIIPSTSYFAGDPPQFGPEDSASRRRADDPALPRAPDALYVYGGTIHEHFGHFLLSTLCRYWKTFPGAKIVYHSKRTIDEDFRKPHVAAIMSALGLAARDFIRFSEDTLIPRIVVPAPAFGERHYAHRIYAEMCNAIGNKLSPTPGPPNDVPVFLSKERLRSGVRKYENEGAVTARLRERGFDIVFPEELSVPDQIRLWQERLYVASFAGSALHTSIFAPGKHVFQICEGVVIDSSYICADTVNNANAQYLAIREDAVTDRRVTSDFNYIARLKEPDAIADALCAVVDMAQRSNVYRSTDGARNIVLDVPSRQSSYHPWVPRVPINATSGRLVGGMQFHTDNEACPWWEVDLPSGAVVDRVVVYNRCDDPEALDRCRHIAIVMDGATVYSHEGREPFGGLGSEPLVWRSPEPLPAKCLRVENRAGGYLHLDQVEVFGRT